MSYLAAVLEAQEVDETIEAAVRARRAELEDLLRGGWRRPPRFYYGGSFGKRTMIAAHFDLDLVMYFAPEATNPKTLYAEVEQRLREANHTTARRNVALRLQYTPGWHVDVVPGRAVDESYYAAELYSTRLERAKRTSLKAHIDLARRGDRETIRLLKLWKWRHAVAVGSFVLELAAAEALRGSAGASLEERFECVLRFLAERFPEARLVDPANAENVVTDELHWAEKAPVADAAKRALAGEWERVVW